jgi:hypothetical protein
MRRRVRKPTGHKHERLDSHGSRIQIRRTAESQRRAIENFELPLCGARRVLPGDTVAVSRTSLADFSMALQLRAGSEHRGAGADAG